MTRTAADRGSSRVLCPVTRGASRPRQRGFLASMYTHSRRDNAARPAGSQRTKHLKQPWVCRRVRSSHGRGTRAAGLPCRSLTAYQGRDLGPLAEAEGVRLPLELGLMRLWHQILRAKVPHQAEAERPVPPPGAGASLLPRHLHPQPCFSGNNGSGILALKGQSQAGPREVVYRVTSRGRGRTAVSL